MKSWGRFVTRVGQPFRLRGALSSAWALMRRFDERAGSPPQARCLPHKTRLIAVLCLAVIPAVAEPRIVYSKFFKGSTPEFVSITVEKDGHVVYRRAEDDANGREFSLKPEETREVFTLADKLGDFAQPLESGLKVANMGRKTFRYEDGPLAREVSFNYSENEDAKQLVGWFERITATEEVWLGLDSAIHFDKLGVDQAFLQVRMLWDAHRLIAPEQFLPLLARISKNESFMHMDRERAASLADEIHAGHPAAEAKSSK